MTNALRTFSRHGLILYFAAVAALTTATASVLANATILPAEQQSGDVAYVTGGIAQDESAAMKAAMPHYPLVIEVYQQGGGKNEYTSASVLTISSLEGGKVLNTKLDGPFALLRLKPAAFVFNS
jgi:hypothetical protein